MGNSEGSFLFGGELGVREGSLQVSSLQPYFSSFLERLKGAPSSTFHSLPGQIMSGEGLFSYRQEGVKSVLYGGERSFGNDCGKGTRFVSHHEIEWRLVSYGMRMVIVSEFCEGNVLHPGGGIQSTENSEISFEFLIYSLGFPVGLRMISCGQCEFITKEFS